MTRLEKALRFARERASSMQAAQIALRGMIVADQLTPEELAGLVDIYPIWGEDMPYKINDIINYNGKLFVTITAHTSQLGWEPPIVPALFKPTVPENVIPEWTQPTGAHDAYNIGDLVSFEGQVYMSVIDGNTWSPTAHPQGWELQP